MPHVYILKSENGPYYIGSTSDLNNRIKHHNRGYTHSTSRMGGLTLVLTQEYESLEEARSVERKLKKLKRRDYIEKIIQDGYIKIKP